MASINKYNTLAQSMVKLKCKKIYLNLALYNHIILIFVFFNQLLQFRSCWVTLKHSGGITTSSSSIPCIKSKTKTSNTLECKKRLIKIYKVMKELLLTGYF